MSNNKLNDTFFRAGNYFNIGLLLFSVIPVLALSCYNHPSAADDYCYIFTVRVHGWVGGMSKYYNEWTGRYFGILLNHSNPLLADSFAGFKAASIGLIFALLGSIFFLIRTITPSLKKFVQLGLTGVAAFLFLLKIPSVAEALYWFASFVTYTIPSIMIVLWVACSVQWYQSRHKKRKVLWGMACCFLVFGAIGCSETTLLLMMVLIGAWLLHRAVIIKKPDILMLSVTATALVSCYLLFSSPGNAARLGGNPTSGDLPLSVIVTFKFVAVAVKNWVLGTPILFFTLCWVLCLRRINKSLLFAFSFPLWLTILSYIGILSVTIFPSFYAVSTELDPTLRVVNSLYFFFILGWFYVAGAIAYQTHHLNFGSILRRPIAVAAAYTITALAVALSVLNTPNFKTMYRDWLRGNAKAYDTEMKARYATLMNDNDPNPIIEPIKNRPQSLFVEDITDNPKGWWNWCMAGYFGKETIRLKEESADVRSEN